MDTTAVTVRIRGHVQGVWYRQWTIQEATNRGLVGWVRNRTDGSVEALFYGRISAVKDMIAACYYGPPSASVRDLTITVKTDELTFSGDSRFYQRPTI